MLGSSSRQMPISVSFWTFFCNTMKEGCPQAQTKMKMQTHKVTPLGRVIPKRQIIMVFLYFIPETLGYADDGEVAAQA